MMTEVRHGIAIGLVCVFATVTIGSFIAQGLAGGHEQEAGADVEQKAAPAAEAPAENAPKAE